MSTPDDELVHADYFNIWTGLGLVVSGALLVIFGPLPWLSVIFGSAGAVLCALPATYITNRYARNRLLSIGCALLWLSVVCSWPLGLLNPMTMLLLALLAYLVVVIGKERVVRFARGEEAVEKMRAQADLAEARESLPKLVHSLKLPKGTVLESREKDGTDEVMRLRLPPGSVANAPDARERYASFAGIGLDDVATKIDPTDNGVLEIREKGLSAFETGMKSPKGKRNVLQMGYRSTGAIVGLPIESESAGHFLAAGQTGSGKSSSLKRWITEWLVQTLLGTKVELWAGDPSGGRSLRAYRRFFDRWATQPDSCVQMLVDAAEEIERRYAVMTDDPSEPETWPGHWLAVAVDELQQVLEVGGSEALAAVNSILGRGRGARVALGLASLSLRANTIGGDAKGQVPTRFCHRVGNQTEVGVILDRSAQAEIGKGSGPTKITAKGRAYAVLPEGSGYPELQVFEPHTPADLEAAGVRAGRAYNVVRESPALPTEPLPTDLPARAHPDGETPAYVRGREGGRSVGRSPGAESAAKVVGALLDHGPLSARQVAAKAGVALSTAQAALKRLHDDGKVTVGEGGRWVYSEELDELLDG